MITYVYLNKIKKYDIVYFNNYRKYYKLTAPNTVLNAIMAYGK